MDSTHFNIGTAVTTRHAATSIAHRLALIVECDDSSTRACTYAELDDLSARFHSLLDALGLDADARVMIRLPNAILFPVSFFGTLRSGRIAVPVSTQLTPREIAFLARDSGAQTIIMPKADWPAFAGTLAEVTSLRAVLLTEAGEMPSDTEDRIVLDLETVLHAVAPSVRETRTRADDPAYLVYTSGTTGLPKGVLHAHRSLLGRQPASEHWFDFAEHDCILHSGKFNWTYVLGTALMDPMYRGHTVVVYEGRNDPAVWPRLLAKHGCSIFIGVPTIYRQILRRTEANRADVPALRSCMSAGEHLSDDVLHAWSTRFGVPIHQGLGMSEFSYYISQHRSFPLRSGATGKVQPGHEVSIVDEHLQPIAAGQEGMIVVSERDPGLFLRYWNRPDEDQKSRRGGYFLTGDYASSDTDGYVWFLGRRDDLINSFGYRVSPYEIERVMKAHPLVDDCVAFGEDLGQGRTLVSLFVLPVHGQTPGDALAERVLEFARERLATYKTPKKVHFVAAFPRNKNGKIMRAELARSFARQAVSA